MIFLLLLLVKFNKGNQEKNLMIDNAVCETGYLYKNLTCLKLCPSTFIQKYKPKECINTDTSTLFELSFSYPSEIESLQDLIDSNHNNSKIHLPFATLHNGLYFFPSSYLKIKNNFVVAPDFSFGAFLKIFDDGIIFQINVDEKISHKLSYFNESFELEISLESNENESKNFNINFPIQKNLWLTINYNCVEDLDFYSLILGKNVKTLPLFKYTTQSLNSLAIVGDYSGLASFSGYLYLIKASNSVTYYNFQLSIKECSLDEYYDIKSSQCEKNFNKINQFGLATQSSHFQQRELSYLVGEDSSGGIYYDACPFGYVISSSTCLISSSNYQFNISLNTIQDLVSDPSGVVSFETGNNTDFYPNGNIYDPIPAVQRGYYFSNFTYMTSTPFIMSYNFTYYFFIKVIGSGVILTKNLFKVLANPDYFVILNNTTANFSSARYTPNWNNLILKVTHNYNSTTIICIQLSKPNTIKCQIFSIGAFIDTNSSLILGSSTSSFTGFIWNMTYYSKNYAFPALSMIMCNSTITTNCLWNCDLNSYFNGSTYNICNNLCSNGCKRGTDCGLCEDVNCVSCTSFTGTCSQCLPNFYYNSSACVCEEGFFMQNNSCVNCDLTCLNCSGKLSSDCLSCSTNAGLINGSCVCNNNFFWNGTSCQACFTGCSACIGPASYQCLSCITGYSSNNNSSCTKNSNSCGNLQFFNTSTMACESCNSKCLSCKSQSETQCLSCYNNLTLSNGTCFCDTGYYNQSNFCVQCDNTCKVCQNNNNYLCLECRSGYELVRGLCEKCQSNEYYDSLNQTCNLCNGTCLQCMSPYLCLLCPNNSLINAEGQCDCKNGYGLNGKNCVRNYFGALFSLDTDNDITLIFTKSLIRNLSISDLNIILDGITQNFTLEYHSNSEYLITILFTSDIGNNSDVIIFLNKSLESVDNSLLFTQNLTFSLFENNDFSNNNKINYAKELAVNGVKIGLATLFGASFISFDPTSFFSFLSTSELYAAISLFNIEVSQDLLVFLYSLKVQKSIPNLLSEFFDKSTGVKLSEKYNNYDLNTNFMLINSGISLTVFGVTLISYFTILILYRNSGKFKSKMVVLLKYFEYYIFLRLWIQTYLEISLNSFTELLFNDFSEGLLIFDGILCIFFLVINNQTVQVLGIPALIYLILNKSKNSLMLDNKFNQYYGMFFEEFKNGDVSNNYFYLLYVLRRISIAISVTFIKNGLFQLIFSLTFSISVNFI